MVHFLTIWLVGESCSSDPHHANASDQFYEQMPDNFFFSQNQQSDHGLQSHFEGGDGSNLTHSLPCLARYCGETKSAIANKPGESDY